MCPFLVPVLHIMCYIREHHNQRKPEAINAHIFNSWLEGCMLRCPCRHDIVHWFRSKQSLMAPWICVGQTKSRLLAEVSRLMQARADPCLPVREGALASMFKALPAELSSASSRVVSESSTETSLGLIPPTPAPAQSMVAPPSTTAAGTSHPDQHCGSEAERRGCTAAQTQKPQVPGTCRRLFILTPQTCSMRTAMPPAVSLTQIFSSVFMSRTSGKVLQGSVDYNGLYLAMCHIATARHHAGVH